VRFWLSFVQIKNIMSIAVRLAEDSSKGLTYDGILAASKFQSSVTVGGKIPGNKKLPPRPPSSKKPIFDR
jgi:hypothetical protein